MHSYHRERKTNAVLQKDVIDESSVMVQHHIMCHLLSGTFIMLKRVIFADPNPGCYAVGKHLNYENYNVLYL